AGVGGSWVAARVLGVQGVRRAAAPVSRPGWVTGPQALPWASGTPAARGANRPPRRHSEPPLAVRRPDRVRCASPPARGAGSGGTIAMPLRRALDLGGGCDRWRRGRSLVELRVPRHHWLWFVSRGVAPPAADRSCSTPFLDRP